MDKRFASLDWTLIRAFVAVAQGGSLSAAARDLDTSQPTVGRQIQSLQDTLGVVLFARRPKGMELTPDGVRLLPFAEQMMRAAGQFSMAATGTDADKSGTVRLTASVFVAHYVLPNLLAELRQREPLIQIELVASDTSDNLLYRDADIALRMYRPDQLDVVTRHLSDIELGIFAAKTYLDRRGKPEQPDDLLQHDLVGYDRNDLIIRTMRQFGWDVTPETFATRCDSQSAYWELVRSGCGIGFGQAKVARRDSTLEQVLHNLPIPTLPVWIAAPNAVRHSTRVAAVWDHLVAGFTS